MSPYGGGGLSSGRGFRAWRSATEAQPRVRTITNPRGITRCMTDLGKSRQAASAAWILASGYTTQANRCKYAVLDQPTVPARPNDPEHAVAAHPSLSSDRLPVGDCPDVDAGQPSPGIRPGAECPANKVDA